MEESTKDIPSRLHSRISKMLLYKDNLLWLNFHVAFVSSNWITSFLNSYSFHEKIWKY